MEYMLLIYADEKIYQAMPEPDMERLVAAYHDYSAELAAAGVLVSGAELAPVHTATTVRIQDGAPASSAGPVAPSAEQLGGYFRIECASLEDALAWAAKCPAARGGAVEVRPITS